MYTVLLVIHVVITLALIGVILFQRSSTDGLGLSGGGNSVMSGRTQANLLTRTTGILAGAFLFTSLALGYLVKHERGGFASELEARPAAASGATTTAPAPGTMPALDGKNPAPLKPAAPAVPDAPKVPTGE